MSYEYCANCDEPTGHAGKADDSLYTGDGKGPFCDRCYRYEASIEQLEAENEELRLDRLELWELRTALATVVGNSYRIENKDTNKGDGDE